MKKQLLKKDDKEKKTLTEFMGYPLFNKIRNPILRAYNQANIYINIKERHGSVPAERYLKKLNRNEQLSVFTMMKRFHDDGYKQTRRNIMRECI